MKRRAWWRPALAVLLGALAAGGVLGWQRHREWRERPDRKTVAQLQQEIRGLADERDRLRARLEAGLRADPRAKDLPQQSVRIGVPAALSRTLIERLATGMADQVALEVRNLPVRKQGVVHHVVRLGEYDLRLNVSRVRARITTGTPTVTFERNRMALAIPVRLASGTGEAEIDFTWDGRNVTGLVCGDLTVKEVVTGSVRPISERVTGALTFSTTGQRLVVVPRLGPLRLHLTVVPSEASWATVQRILDSRSGVCGMVLSRVDIRGALDRLLEQGFNVTVPTGKLRPVTLPVGVHSVLTVKGHSVPVSARAGTLAMSPDIIWLGAEVDIDTHGIVSAR